MFPKSIHVRNQNIFDKNWNLLLNESLGNVHRQRILDVGCGDAKFSHYLTKTQNEYVGVDLQVGPIYLSRNVNIIRADAAHLPFRDNCFDLSFSRELLHHVTFPPRVIKEMYRVGKRVVIIEANKNVPYMIWACYEGHKHFSPIEFQNILETTIGINPKIRFVGIYSYRKFPIFFSRLLKAISLICGLKIKEAFKILILSASALLEDLLFFLTMFAPILFFGSKLFANSFLGLEMIFDSRTNAAAHK